LFVTGQAIALRATPHHVRVGLVERGRVALHRHAELPAQVDGLGIGHAELFRQFVYSQVLRHSRLSLSHFVVGFSHHIGSSPPLKGVGQTVEHFIAHITSPRPLESATPSRGRETSGPADPGTASSGSSRHADHPRVVHDASEEFHRGSTSATTDTAPDRCDDSVLVTRPGRLVCIGLRLAVDLGCRHVIIGRLIRGLGGVVIG